MGRLLLVLFIVIPLVEAFLLIQLGGVIGYFETFALVVLMGFLGAWLARAEGLRTWRRWREALAEGRMPDEGVLSGLLVLVGGVLLITPGVLTDVLGFLLLLPPTRRRIADFMRPRLEKYFEQSVANADASAFRVVHYQLRDVGPPVDRPREVIDADFEVSEPNER